MNCKQKKDAFNERVLELNELYESNEIDYLEYRIDHDAASVAFGIATISKWPCPPVPA